MERFIAFAVFVFNSLYLEFKIQYGEIYSLNSLQCRLSPVLFKIQYGEIYRFSVLVFVTPKVDLKSSMERFIANVPAIVTIAPIFKIQYGEIYSHVPVSVCTPTPKFKIQYGEIYSKKYHLGMMFC